MLDYVVCVPENIVFSVAVDRMFYIYMSLWFIHFKLYVLLRVVLLIFYLNKYYIFESVI